jgi:hypothetical protein
VQLQLVAIGLAGLVVVANDANRSFLIAGANIASVDAFAEFGKPLCRNSDDSIIVARAADDNDTAGALNRIEKA